MYHVIMSIGSRANYDSPFYLCLRVGACLRLLIMAATVFTVICCVKQERGDLFELEDEEAMEKYAWAIPDERALRICANFGESYERLEPLAFS